MARRIQYLVSASLKDILVRLKNEDGTSMNQICLAALNSKLGLGPNSPIDQSLISNPDFPSLGVDDSPYNIDDLAFRPQAGYLQRIHSISLHRKTLYKKAKESDPSTKNYSGNSNWRILQEIIRLYLLDSKKLSLTHNEIASLLPDGSSSIPDALDESISKPDSRKHADE